MFRMLRRIFPLYGAAESLIDTHKVSVRPPVHFVKKVGDGLNFDSVLSVTVNDYVNLDHPIEIQLRYSSLTQYSVTIIDAEQKTTQFVGFFMVGNQVNTNVLRFTVNEPKPAGTVYTSFIYEQKPEWDRGLLERYNEVVGTQIDIEFMPKLEHLIDHLLIPLTVQDSHIKLLEKSLGQDFKNYCLFLSNNLPMRRAVLHHIFKYYNLKGTPYLYELLFGMIGIDVELNDEIAPCGFDSPVALDFEYRTFDSCGCNGCTPYGLVLTGASLTPALYAAIQSIITFNEPINADLVVLTYNGVDILPEYADAPTDGDFSPDDFNNDFLTG